MYICMYGCMATVKSWDRQRRGGAELQCQKTVMGSGAPFTFAFRWIEFGIADAEGPLSGAVVSILCWDAP
jgi:hypothetical protein